MLKLKVKKQNKEPQVFNCNNWQEVANIMQQFCNIEDFKKTLAEKKETNIRFYLINKSN